MTPLDLGVLAAGGVLGAGAGRLLRLPMWPLVGALLGAAVADEVVGGGLLAPTWWSVTAQVLVGTAVGAAIHPGTFDGLRALVRPGSVTVALIIAVGLLGGFLVAATATVDTATAVLGLVPGGAGEMVAAAAVLGADSAVVALMAVVRLVLVLVSVPLLLRLVTRLGGRGGG